MHRATRLKLTDINQHFLCVLCDGYIIDATTIVECLHSFCRTCIVQYLQNSAYCPVCDVQVHKTKPLQSLRSDKALQDVIYKLIPGLYQNEMQRRRDFYAEHPEAAAQCSSEERGEGAEQRCFYDPQEHISLSLEYFFGGNSKELDDAERKEAARNLTRYLNCPAALTVAHLKKFLRTKFTVPTSHQINILYANHLLHDNYTLMDIAYIYAWRRAGPMKFYFTFTRCPAYLMPKRITTAAVATARKAEDSATDNQVSTSILHNTAESVSSLKPVEDMEIDSAVSDSTTVQTEISDNVKMDVRDNAQMNMCNEIQMDVSDSLQTCAKNVIQDDTKTNADSTVPEKMEVEPERTQTTPLPTPPTIIAPNLVTITTSQERRIQPTMHMVNSHVPATVVPTSSGLKVKFHYYPEIKSAKNPVAKKGGRKSRQKSIPLQRFPRLAPYPPNHNSGSNSTSPVPSIVPNALANKVPLAKYVPTMVTTLAPTLIAPLVSTTMNTMCNPTKNSIVLSHAPFMGCQVTNNSNNFVGLNGVASSSSVPSTLQGTPAVASTIAGAGFSMPCTNVITVPTVNSPVNILPNSLTNCSSPPVQSNSPSISQAIISPKPMMNQPVLNSPPLYNVRTVPAMNGPIKNSSLGMLSNFQAVNGTSPVSSTNTSVHVPISPAIPSTTVTEQSSSSMINDGFPSVNNSNEVSSASKSPLLDETGKLTIVLEPEKSNNAPLEIKATPVEKLECNGLPISPLAKSCSPVLTIDQQSESFKERVKNSISAEFSDNDDLGCPSDLIVDEQKMDSSDNEDDADTALRKKITAIAEKEDETDEVDSGRASDMSSQARSICDDDIGSPNPAASEPVTASTTSTNLLTFTLAVTKPTSTATTSIASELSQRQSKSSKINNVIDNLLRNHEKKDLTGALDLSTCLKKKAGQETSPTSCRSKGVANPVLDIKHRQQTYLPAPGGKQASVSSSVPKPPSNSAALLQNLASHHNHTLLPPTVPGPGKTRHLPIPVFPMPFPSQSGRMSVPMTLESGRSTPMPHPLSSSSHHIAGLHPCSPLMRYPVAPSINTVNALARIPSGTSILKRPSSPPTSILYSKLTSNSPRKHGGNSSTKSIASRGGMMFPGTQASYPISPSVGMRLSPHHRSASPAPTPNIMTPIPAFVSNTRIPLPEVTPSISIIPIPSTTYVNSVGSKVTNPFITYTSGTKPINNGKSTCVPMNNNTNSSTSIKPSISIYPKKSSPQKNNYSKFKSGTNLTVINPDPSGYSPKIVIRNMDAKPASTPIAKAVK